MEVLWRESFDDMRPFDSQIITFKIIVMGLQVWGSNYWNCRQSAPFHENRDDFNQGREPDTAACVHDAFLLSNFVFKTLSNKLVCIT